MTPAKDQGGCGSCWSFAAVGALESKILINVGPEYDLSEQQQISCNSDMDGCVGGSMDTLKFWYNEKPVEESCARYVEDKTACSSVSHCGGLPYHTTDFYYVDADNIASVKSSLHDDGPAYFRFDVYSDFEGDFGSGLWWNGSSGEVYTHSSGYERGGHGYLGFRLALSPGQQ